MLSSMCMRRSAPLFDWGRPWIKNPEEQMQGHGQRVERAEVERSCWIGTGMLNRTCSATERTAGAVKHMGMSESPSWWHERDVQAASALPASEPWWRGRCKIRSSRISYAAKRKQPSRRATRLMRSLHDGKNARAHDTLVQR